MPEQDGRVGLVEHASADPVASYAAQHGGRRLGPTSRRALMAGAAATLLLTSRARPLHATPEEMRTAIRNAVGDGPLEHGRITLDIPALVENGNSVPLTVAVESPMTAADHVAEIHVFSPENPLPIVTRFVLGPRCGKAIVRTTIRMATTQVLHVVAVMSNGTRWLATAEVEVTTAACFDHT